MPGIVRKLLIFAAVDGLILQPAPPRNHKPATDQAIKISYTDAKIGPLLKDRRHENTAKETLEAHGIIGLLRVASYSFLVSISRRDQVALIRGRPIYAISEIALIPLSSQSDAEQAIVRARSAQFRHSTSNEDFLNDSSDSEDDITLPDDASVATAEPDPETPYETGKAEQLKAKKSSVVEDVITKKGVYGRFTDRWFSKKGWTADNRTQLGLSSQEDLQKVKHVADDPTTNPGTGAGDGEQQSKQRISKSDGPELASDEGIEARDQMAPGEVAHVVESESQGPQIALLPKLLNTAKVFFGSKNFFFSYDYDLSQCAANQPANSLGLHRSFDPQFFWNQNLLRPFREAGQEDFSIPIIQGFVGQREFTAQMNISSGNTIQEAQSDPKDIQNTVLQKTQEQESSESESSADEPKSRSYLLTLISRRSVDRAGLRYLRRGADEEGHVANSVETEQLLCSPTWDGANTLQEKLYSYVQYRGSIPVFFSQSAYSLKPLPVFRGTATENLAAFKLHFKELADRYGKVQVASLVEKKGNESKVGELFQKNVEESKMFSSEPNATLAFEWFDFHHVCKGMKFENVSILFDLVGKNLNSYGWTTQRGGEVIDKQSGVLRTNCMDCLDRTNVVQSAAGRLVLESQLSTEGISIDLQHDPSTSWFNTLWADNGDAISRQYAGTAALKGDFTRTRKRNISGALTDFGLTLSRYYNNIVNDYFAQAVIDFLLGRADESIFIDFEADMKSQDYAIDLRKVRQNAIETCSTICVDESGSNGSEHLVSGWCLRCPRISNTTKTHPFEECILLLTNRCLYFCRMDWSVEKVQAFEKIELESITSVFRGAFITNTLAARDLDEKRNVGFLVKYSTGGKDLVRVNTRSLTSNEEEGKKAEQMNKGKGKPADEKFLAFKALPPRSNYVMSKNDENPPSEQESTQLMCDQIVAEVNRVRKGIGMDPKEALETKEEDVVSLAEAKSSTGYLEAIGYSLKKLVWAS